MGEPRQNPLERTRDSAGRSALPGRNINGRCLPDRKISKCWNLSLLQSIMSMAFARAKQMTIQMMEEGGILQRSMSRICYESYTTMEVPAIPPLWSVLIAIRRVAEINRSKENILSDKVETLRFIFHLMMGDGQADWPYWHAEIWECLRQGGEGWREPLETKE
jgi:hypothetical protein